VIFAGPGIGENKTASTFAEMVDILPTLLELADVSTGHTHFGKSLVPSFDDPDASIRDRAFSEGGFGLHELELLEQPAGEYKNKGELQHQSPKVVGKAISMRTEHFTYVFRLYESDELYDRRVDPNETHNLLTEHDHEATVHSLKTQLLEWLMETADCIPWEADPRFPKIPHGQHQLFEN